MTKIVAIGDIHGRTCWKQIVEKHKYADRIIFIGDYVDTHENYTGLEQLENLREIINFKEENKEKVVLLIGNHDFQYWPGIENEIYSGYQAGMAASFRYEFETYKKLFQMCYVDQHDTIYSHAGFTESFINRRIGSFSEKNINDIFKYKPQTFNFFYGDRNGCGDDVRQSCIWVRPNSLHKDKIDNFQVVGHTRSGQIVHSEKSERKGFYVIDALPNQCLIRIDEKFIIENV